RQCGRRLPLFWSPARCRSNSPRCSQTARMRRSMVGAGLGWGSPGEAPTVLMYVSLRSLLPRFRDDVPCDDFLRRHAEDDRANHLGVLPRFGADGAVVVRIVVIN